MIVFAHTKFGLVRIQGSEVKRGAEFAPPVWASFSNPGPDRVKITPSHVTYRVFEFYLNSEALHFSRKASHVTYGVLEFYLNFESIASL